MWHELSADKVVALLKTNASRGLTYQDVLVRQKKFGVNELPRGKQKRWWQFLIEQFRSPMVYILLVAAILSAWLQEWIDMAVIMLSVCVNVSVGFWQEFRSSNILQKLQSYVRTSAQVVREGRVTEINSSGLVPGDVILLKTGMRVPADARLIRASHLEADEAVLTGESVPVKKNAEASIDPKAVIGDRSTMVHMGTVIARGEGLGVVVTIGSATELGTIALLTVKTDDEETPLQARIGRLGTLLMYLIGASSLLILIIGLLENHSFHEMFITTVAVAVAAIPEGMPAAISIVLAVAASRVLRVKGVVKRLVAAETLGSASVICTDKTGTLTEGKMEVEKLFTEGIDDRARLVLALANEALVEAPEKVGDAPKISGEVTDQAKMHAFLKNGGSLNEALTRYPRKSLLPFDSDRKYLASLHGNGAEGGYTLFVSGAPEVVFGMSSYIAGKDGTRPISADDRHRISRLYEQLAGNGFRTIAIAERVFPVGEKLRSADLEEADVREGAMQSLAFVGLAAIRDPIRADVKESIELARGAGIRVIMLTGDHALTASAIGADLGFKSSPAHMLTGDDIDSLSDQMLTEKIRTVEICARVSPKHKLRIVELLEKEGEVTAMTGDGVNDAPALKAANIGVALGSGTDVAKEASDLVLLDDSFTTIVAAIRQGRIAFDNIRKVAVFLLVQSFTELLLILSALVFGIPLPFTALMILWTNLVEDALPNIALSFEPGEDDVMKRKPIAKNEPILDRPSKYIVFLIGLSSDVILLTAFVALDFWSTLSLDHLRTIIFAAVGIDSFFYIYSIKSLRQPLWRTRFFDNPYLTGATAIGLAMMFAAIYVPFLQSVLGTVGLTFENWVLIGIYGLIKIIGVEGVKIYFASEKRERKNTDTVDKSAQPLLS